MSIPPLIAVVDDDLSMREALLSLLRSVGLSAVVYASAEDFLQAGHLLDVTCLIVDVRMPRMSGLELQRQLIKARCTIPLIFITAHEDGEARARALRAGAVAFLAKPFSDEVLLRVVQAVIQATDRAERPAPLAPLGLEQAGARLSGALGHCREV